MAHGRAIPTRGILKQAYQVAVMILNETTTTRTEQHYVINKGCSVLVVPTELLRFAASIHDILRTRYMCT